MKSGAQQNKRAFCLWNSKHLEVRATHGKAALNNATNESLATQETKEPSFSRLSLVEPLSYAACYQVQTSLFVDREATFLRE